MKQKTFWLDTIDDEAIATIQHRYGCESQSQAIRMAVRIVAASEKIEVSRPPVSKFSKTRKTPQDLRGLWNQPLPNDFDLDVALQEIRNAWKEDLDSIL